MDLLVNIDVDDLARAEVFYTSAFDLRVSRRLGAAGLELAGASSRIYLLAKESGSQATSGPGTIRDYRRHWTPVHLDFVVEDIERAVRKAVEAGASPEGPTQAHAWGLLALMADPFGHGFCLVQFLGRGYGELEG